MYIIGAMHQVAEANWGNLQCRPLHAELKKRLRSLIQPRFGRQQEKISIMVIPKTMEIYGNVMYHND